MSDTTKRSFRMTKMNILRVVHTTKASVIFQVKMGQEIYALKVYHMDKRPEDLESPWLSRWYCETKAYERLKAEGVCDSGHVLKLFATFPYFDPAITPEIETEFGSDKHRPCALLLEWIEVRGRINKDTYTPERWAKCLESFRRFNAAAILHRDIHLRNCIITAEAQERVIWVDYDIARTLDPQNMTDHDKEWLKKEVRIVVDTAEVIEEYAAIDMDIPWE